MLYRTALAFAFFCALTALAAPGRAQDRRYFQVDLDRTRPYGPYRGVVRWTIGRDAPAGALNITLKVRIVRGGETVFQEASRRVPFLFEWDTSALEDGEYRLQVIAIDRDGRETVKDEVPRLKIENGNPPAAAPRPTPAPVETPPPPVRLGASGARQIVVSGTVTIPLSGLETLRGGQVPIVVIRRGNYIAVRNADVGAGRPLRWDSREVPNGVYTAQVVIEDLDVDAPERVFDEVQLTVNNPVRTTTPIAWRATGTPGRFSRPVPGARLSLPRVRVDFALVEALSRQAGDPHPRVAAAQWALETGWGRSYAGAYNLFGIKARPGQAGTLQVTKEYYGDGLPVTETARFADYASAEASVRARLEFLGKPRYSGYGTAASDEEACRALQSGGYATDPGYAQKLIAILRRGGRR